MRYTELGRGNTEQNRRNNERTRNNIIRELFHNLKHFENRGLAEFNFGFHFDQHYIDDAPSAEALFLGIAEAISNKKGMVSNFHHKKLEEKSELRGFEQFGRDLFYWHYMHYKITVYTKISPPVPGFASERFLKMKIVDLNKRFDNADSDESGNDTDNDNDPLKPTMMTCFILQSLHDRIKKLEASCGLQPTASQRRLG